MTIVLFFLSMVGLIFLLPPIMAAVALVIWLWSAWAGACIERIYHGPRRRIEGGKR